MSFKVKK